MVKTIARKTFKLKNHKIDKIKKTSEGPIIIYISHKKRQLLPCENHEEKYKVVDHFKKEDGSMSHSEDVKLRFFILPPW